MVRGRVVRMDASLLRSMAGNEEKNCVELGGRVRKQGSKKWLGKTYCGNLLCNYGSFIEHAHRKFPQLPVACSTYCTASDGKLGRAWEQVVTQNFSYGGKMLLTCHTKRSLPP